MKKGKLYMLPTTIGSHYKLVIPEYVVEKIHNISVFIVENARTARRWIRETEFQGSIQDLLIFELDKHDSNQDIRKFLDPAFEGKNIGVLSEAGCPAIADPGSKIVQIAHRIGIDVIPMVGPSSIFLALMASGLNGQNFAFSGYLPIEKSAKLAKIKQLENLSFSAKQAQIFMETPYRNQKFFDDLCNTLSPKTMLCIASNISLDDEFIKTRTISEWKKQKPDINKKPTIFIIQKF